MSFYDAFKDALNVAQKADNLELYRQLLDLSAQALDMQEEIDRIKKENQKLIAELKISRKIIRHQEGYITLSDDEDRIPYCSVCYGNMGKLVQVADRAGICKICGTRYSEFRGRSVVSQGIKY